MLGHSSQIYNDNSIGKPLFGLTLALMGTVFFSIKSIIVKLGYNMGMSPEALMAARYVFSLPFYIIIGLYGIKNNKPDKKNNIKKYALRALFLGILGFWVSSYLDFLGLKYITAQLERMVLFTYPMLVVILGIIFFRYKMSYRNIIASIVSYVGIIVLFLNNLNYGSNVGIGVGLVFMAALTFAFYQLLAKPVINNMGVPIATAIMMTGACLASFVPFVLHFPLADLTFTKESMVLILILSVGGTVLPSVLLNMALSRISSQVNAVIGALGPMVTIGLAAVFLNEELTWSNAGGMLLTIFGVVWFTIIEAYRKQPNLPAPVRWDVCAGSAALRVAESTGTTKLINKEY